MNGKKEHIGRKVVVLSHIIRRNIDQRTEEAGLSGPQSRMLHYIAENSAKKDVFQRDVENEFHIRRSSVTSLVQQLEKSGLITRVSVDFDARLKKLVLTEKGRQVRNEIGSKIDTFEEEIYQLLGENAVPFIKQLETLISELND